MAAWRVIWMFSWSRCQDTVTIGTPAASNQLAQVCLRLCGVRLGSNSALVSARSQMARNAGQTVGLVNVNSDGDQHRHRDTACAPARVRW